MRGIVPSDLRQSDQDGYDRAAKRHRATDREVDQAVGCRRWTGGRTPAAGSGEHSLEADVSPDGDGVSEVNGFAVGGEEESGLELQEHAGFVEI